MQNRAQIEAKLRQETRDQIFNRQIASVIERKQDEMAKDERTYAEKVDWTKYTMKRPSLAEAPVYFKIAGDDKFKSKKWEALMSDCAFYMDRPTI